MSFSRSLILSASIALASSVALAQEPATQAPAIAPSASAAPAAAANPGRPVTREELPGLIRAALLNEPEIIMDAAKKLREKQEATMRKQSAEGLQKYKADIFNNPDAPSAGAKDADVLIAEFFDYHCGYCKHMLPVVAQLLKEDKKVRFVFLEFPILSEDSVTAARAALAVNRIAKDKYFDFHQALMKSNGKFDEKTVLDAAKKVGVDSAKLKAEMAKPEITAILDKNREMAGALGISGTPGLIIGNEIAPGAVDYDTLKKMVEAVRGGKQPSEAIKAANEEAAAAKPASEAAPAPAEKPAAPVAVKAVPAPAAAPSASEPAAKQ